MEMSPCNANRQQKALSSWQYSTQLALKTFKGDTNCLNYLLTTCLKTPNMTHTTHWNQQNRMNKLQSSANWHKAELGTKCHTTCPENFQRWHKLLTLLAQNMLENSKTWRTHHIAIKKNGMKMRHKAGKWKMLLKTIKGVSNYSHYLLTTCLKTPNRTHTSHWNQQNWNAEVAKQR